jgi:hypothetical protein
MTSPIRSLGSPAVTLGLAALLGSLLVLALAAGLLGGFGGFGSGETAAIGSTGPSSADVASTSARSLTPTLGYPTPSPAPTFTTYTVRVGDTLSSIARVFHTTARSISWWNRGAHPSLDPESPGYAPNSIKPGWSLAVLDGATVDEENPPSPSPGPATPLPPSDPPGSTAAPVPSPAPTPTAAPTR